MKCPQCDAKMRVVDCAEYGKGVYRRRKCPECKNMIYTEEVKIKYSDGKYMLNLGRKKGKLL